jgi:hypothetical protein
MLHRFRRRLSRIEESLPHFVTAERFVGRAHRLGRHTGENLGSAMAAVARDLTDGELDSLTAEFERIVFGSDTAARDKAKRKLLSEAGFVHAGQTIEGVR